MKYYKSFILFSLFALAFVSCNTDDLERDIDALKDRVTNVEAQVQQLNDEMNIIRVLLDGNKTITDYSINGDTYTLTLSNGETLTLTPGVTGGNYPSIEIGAMVIGLLVVQIQAGVLKRRMGKMLPLLPNLRLHPIRPMEIKVLVCEL